MKISMQVCLNNGWDNNKPAIHEVTDWKQAMDMAYVLSHQFGNTTVRVCKLDHFPNEISLGEYVGRLSGTYIQSTAVNYDTECIFTNIPKGWDVIEG